MPAVNDAKQTFPGTVIMEGHALFPFRPYSNAFLSQKQTLVENPPH